MGGTMTASRRLVLRLVTFTCTGALLTLPGCSTSLPRRGTPAPGTYVQTTPLRYRLSARTYLVHIPLGYDQQKAWPLVLVLHGAFATARSIEERSGFSALADHEGFVVYPNGIGLFGSLQHWNAGHCCGLAQVDHVDDVGFLRYVIRDVASKIRIDPRRIYVAGHSNGAMLAYRFASEDCEQIAGVAVVAGTIGSSKSPQEATCTVGPPRTPVPLIAVHGREDESVPFTGGPGLHGGPRRYVSVPDSVERWAQYCGCLPGPEVCDDPLGNRRTLTWHDEKGNSVVVLHVLDHWKHVWPGTTVTGRLPEDHPLRTFEAAQVIWDFFRTQTLFASR